MADPSKIAILIQQVAMGVNAHDREHPDHNTWGIGMAHFDIERLDLEEGEELIPGIVLQADGGQTGQFRILCDGQHDQGEVEEEEEMLDAVAGQELVEPLQAPGPAPRIRPPRPGRVTYSIVGRDPDTGELGVAVQSHWFSVGSIVTWARPGIGAVATQANAEPAYGPRALDLMAAGVPAPDALAQLVAEDPRGHSRQVAVLDAAGRVAAHTGPSCIAHAGHVTGDGVVEANIMASEGVWPAMLEAFRAGRGSLTERLLLALEAAEAEGGDVRGRQSAAILVVPAEGEPWRTVVSLRVEDHPEPLPELRRLLALHDAYSRAGQADELLAAGRHDEATRLYVEASERAPDNHELLFWAGLGRAQAGDLDAGVAQVKAAIELQPAWRELLPRLPADMAPAAPAVLARL